MTDTVLIVDDSVTVRMDLAEAFEAAGFHVVPSATLADARAVLGRESVAVLVLDVVLPDGDGVELLREVRAAPATFGVAVLMLSTEAEVHDRIRGLQSGADEYVGKPYDKSYVVAKARELLRSRSAEVRAGPTILVIDDSSTYREALRATLEHGGYAVLTASSGEEGLRAAADQRPSAIVVDGMLPGIDGATVVRRLRLDAGLRGIPCVLLSASEDRAAELRALDAGADGFIRKGEDFELVLAKLGAMLRTAGDPPDRTRSLLGPKRILAVDDSITYLQELAATLTGEGYDVVLARSGEEALDLLAVQPVDCILLDLMMPGLGGHETCRRIKAASAVRDIPLIMLTALEDPAAMLTGLAAGADDYIPKSGEFDVLKARVRAQIRRKQFEDEHRRTRDELLRTELEASETRAARLLAATRATLVEQLERKNRELEAFTSAASHDLRAPLRSIEGFSQILLEEYGDRLDEQGRMYLRQVCGGAHRMSELIHDLLELSRVSSRELRREPVDLAELARLIVADLQRADPERTVEVRIQATLPVDADSRLMRIVLQNLLGNAWKYSSRVAGARIEFAGSEATERVYAVRDNGAGFDMAHAEKLFRPFQRLHAESDFPGTGVGLATVQRIVDRHGGRVWAEGVVGAGATFFFTLPPRSSADG